MEKLSLPVLFGLLVLIVLLQAFLFMWLTRSTRARRLSAKLMDASQANDFEKFKKLSEGLTAKQVLGKLELCYEQLQFYSMNNKETEMDLLLERVFKLNVDPKKKRSLMIQMWRYYMDNGNQEKVERLAAELKKIYDLENNTKAKDYLEFMMNIYIYADNKMEAELFKLIKEHEGEKKILYQQHLASLYLKQGEDKKALKLLESVKENSSSKLMIESLIFQLKQRNKKKGKNTSSQ